MQQLSAKDDALATLINKQQGDFSDNDVDIEEEQEEEIVEGEIQEEEIGEGAAHPSVSRRDSSSTSSDASDSSTSDSTSDASDSEMLAPTVSPAAPAPALAAPEGAGHRRVTTRSFENREVLQIEGLGELRYYLKTGVMSAVCSKHAAADCRRSSTTKPKTGKLSGRPLGHLMAWLQQQDSYDGQTAHVHTCRPSHSERAAAREYFSTLEHANTWLAYEKAKAPGDPDEPSTL